MLGSIKEAQQEGRILPDIKVDYNTVEKLDFIHTTHQIHPELEQVTRGGVMSYLLSVEGKKESREVSITRKYYFEADYFIVRHSTHDGTLAFVLELYEEIVSIILSGVSHSKDSPYDNPQDSWGYDINYEVGNIFHFTDTGLKNINGHEMDGQTDVLVMPVKVSYAKD